MRKNTPWTDEEIKFVTENAGKLTFEQMAEKVGRSKNAVHLFLLRRRIPYKPQVRKNLVLEILQLAFKNPEYFSPTREFYEAVGMTQMRFWSLYRGEVSPTEEEYNKLKKHFGVTSARVFNNRQLNLFENTGGGVKRREKFPRL